MLKYLKNNRILVLVAHPDDEVLGIGATLNKLVRKQECIVRVVILGEGITSRSEKRDPEAWGKELNTHNQNIQDAKDIIGYQELGVYQFPDNRFDGVELLDIIKVIEKEINEFAPDLILTHHGGDLNVDHQACFNAVVTATRPLEGEKVNTLLTFETPSSTEYQPKNTGNQFLPNLYSEITKEELAAKINAMESYEYERRPFPHPRSPEALKNLAERRGIEIGKPLAEGFMLIRHF